jgi:hypothetical protein
MMKWIKRLFTKSTTRHISFWAGTAGMRAHEDFIDWVNENDVKIINAYTLYHMYENSHKPQSFNYVIKYKSV